MFVRIRHRDNMYDFSPDFMLDMLISSRDIEAFYRPSEKRWITVGRDPTRRAEGKLDSSSFRRRKTDT